MSVIFFDFDQDGDFDLFVVNYVQFDVDKNLRCFASTSAFDYCGLSAFTSESDCLWCNCGDGIFEDILVKSGIGCACGVGLGVILGDFNDDGLFDLYVVNDGEVNHLWFNRGDGIFSDDVLFVGMVLNCHGFLEVSMGLVAADFDGDGNEDFFLIYFADEFNMFYCNLGDGLFEDCIWEILLAASSMFYTSFGVVFIDFDNDGWLDLVIANGAV